MKAEVQTIKVFFAVFSDGTKTGIKGFENVSQGDVIEGKLIEETTYGKYSRTIEYHRYFVPLNYELAKDEELIAE